MNANICLQWNFCIYIWIESFFNMVSLCVIWQCLRECLIYTQTSATMTQIAENFSFLLYVPQLLSWECIKMVVYDSWISLSLALTLHACCCCKKGGDSTLDFLLHYYALCWADVNNSCGVYEIFTTIIQMRKSLF